MDMQAETLPSKVYGSKIKETGYFGDNSQLDIDV